MERVTASLDPAIAADSRLIRSEVNRCREILERLSIRGAAPGGETPELVTVSALLSGVSAQFRDAAGLRMQDVSRGLPELWIPHQAVQQALGVLIKNALEARHDGSPVEVFADASHGSLRFVIQDRGEGMTPETLRRIGEPFFTTKEPGTGMGLGVFLARGLAEQLGGNLTFFSVPGEGTTAVLELPAAANHPVGAASR